MYKKVLYLSAVTLVGVLSLTGCSNDSQSSIKNLETQTKRLEHVISQDVDLVAVSPSTISSTKQYNSIQNHKANSYSNLIREEELKEEILELNSALKSCLKNDCKFSKSKTNALKKLTSNISQNLTKYNNTTDEVKKSIGKIKHNLKVPKVNVDGAESEYVTLNGFMSERYVYLCNLYDNLEEAFILIGGCCENNNTLNQETYTQNAKQQSTYNTEEEKNDKKNSWIKKNIDSYAPYQEVDTEKVEDKDKNKKDWRNIDTFNNSIPPSANNNIYNPYGYTNRYNYNNHYNFGYGYANGLRRYNPNRNTDSFYPYNRNIDTYRVNPNYNYPILSTVEKLNDNMEKNEKENHVIKQNHVIKTETTPSTESIDKIKDNVSILETNHDRERLGFNDKIEEITQLKNTR